jgi:hypothetical protein
MDRLNEVTSTSKIIAAVLFIMLPILAFWIGYQYGYDYTGAVKTLTSGAPEENLSITPIVEKRNCEFTLITDGYGVNDVTENEKKVLCDASQNGNDPNAKIVSIQIYGKEGKYIWYGVEVMNLVYVQDNLMTSVSGASNGEVMCNLVDGLGVTHILPTCFEATKDGVGLSRSTK